MVKNVCEVRAQYPRRGVKDRESESGFIHANKKDRSILTIFLLVISHLVGPRGLEPLTSSTSRMRSSQLS